MMRVDLNEKSGTEKAIGLEPGRPIRCLKCGDVIRSEHRHDFKWCGCRSVAIDGGSCYTKVCGEPEDWEFAINPAPPPPEGSASPDRRS